MKKQRQKQVHFYLGWMYLLWPGFHFVCVYFGIDSFEEEGREFPSFPLVKNQVLDFSNSVEIQSTTAPEPIITSASASSRIQGYAKISFALVVM